MSGILTGVHAPVGRRSVERAAGRSPTYQPHLASVRVVLDGLECVTAFVGTTFIQNVVLPPYFAWPPAFELHVHGWMVGLALLTMLLARRLVSAGDPYRPYAPTPFPVLLVLAAGTVLVQLALMALVLFMLHYGIPRSFLLLFGLVHAGSLVATELGVRHLLARLRARGEYVRQAVLVGTGPRAAQFLSLTRQNPHWGLHITGVVTDGTVGPPAGVPWHDVPVWGGPQDVPRLLAGSSVDELILAAPNLRDQTILDLLQCCEQIGVTAKLSLDYFQTSIACAHLERYEGSTLLTFSTVPREHFALFAKTLFDRVAAVLLLCVLGPLVMLPIAIAIRLTSQPGEPILFRQTRTGRSRRTFTFYKFRTMVTDAEELRSTLARKNEMDGPVFKMLWDPRVTRLGRWLRKYSLDELPQLFNVVRGEMSLVGPRPPLPSEVALYEPWQLRRLSMKPGLTCTWQVSGRNKISFAEWMRMDLEYIDTWCWACDLKILLRTIPAVCFGYGM